MNREFAHILDVALAQQSARRPLDQILETYSVQAQQLRPLLECARSLDRIRGVQLPGQSVLEADRLAFLQEITQLDIEPVSPSLVGRINSWIAALNPAYVFKRLIEPKERRKMSAMLANIALILSVILASAGGTVALAANSLPDSPFYEVKLAVEQIQLSLLTDPGKIAAQHLILAQNRSQEILRLAQGGENPETSMALNLQEHYSLALQHAAQLGEAEMQGILTRGQQMAQQQLQEMVQAQSQLRWEYQNFLREPIRILQQTQARVQAGLDDPAAFRWQARFGFGQARGKPECSQDTCFPLGSEHHRRHKRTGAGSHTEDPLLEDSQALDALEPESEEIGSNQDSLSDRYVPEGDEHRYGQPEAPGPGEPGGNPDSDCDDCQLSGDEHHFGPQPDQPGPGEPGGNPDCSQADCEPEGDQHQFGQPPDSHDSGQDGSGGEQSSGQGGRGAGKP